MQLGDFRRKHTFTQLFISNKACNCKQLSHFLYEALNVVLHMKILEENSQFIGIF